MTFKSLYELYIDDLSHRLREHTIINKKYIIELKILPFFKNMKLNDITPVTIRKWQNELLKTKNPSNGKLYSQTYIKNIHNQLTAIFNYAIKFHSLQENPCHKAGSIGKTHAEEMNIWTPEEFKLFIEALKNHHAAYAGFNILFWCGLRIGELLALEVKDIDFENETLNINKSYQRLKKEYIITEPKTPKSKRVLEMPSQLTSVLKDYLKTLYKPKPSTRLIPHTKYMYDHAMRKYSEIAGVKK
ncbi:MAG: tyrosine-type recombinase/integrase [Cetobacterium sp.]